MEGDVAARCGCSCRVPPLSVAAAPPTAARRSQTAQARRGRQTDRQPVGFFPDPRDHLEKLSWSSVQRPDGPELPPPHPSFVSAQVQQLFFFKGPSFCALCFYAHMNKEKSWEQTSGLMRQSISAETRCFPTDMTLPAHLALALFVSLSHSPQLSFPQLANSTLCPPTPTLRALRGATRTQCLQSFSFSPG